jgi:hypothetical protein
MKLKEIKKWIESLPEKFLEFEVMNGEYGELIKEDEITYRLDKPITALTVDEENKEIIFLNDSAK